ncbi:MAG: GNAT family N-acetyltransferase, partial [Ilumatobacteraceae bacterium]
VGFYLARGCRLAGDDTDPELLELEPEDIHLICPLAG